MTTNRQQQAENDKQILEAIKTLKELLDGDDTRFTDAVHDRAYNVLDNLWELEDVFKRFVNK